MRSRHRGSIAGRHLAPALQLISRRLANRDHGRADAPAAYELLDFGKYFVP